VSDAAPPGEPTAARRAAEARVAELEARLRNARSGRVGEVFKAPGAFERFAPLTSRSFQKFVRAR